jgi:hypothetical protein
MYRLLVFHSGETTPRHLIPVARAADVLTRIPEVLAEHPGCEHVVLMYDEIRLFAVDCAGNRLP